MVASVLEVIIGFPRGKAFIHSFTHSLTHSFIHSCTHVTCAYIHVKETEQRDATEKQTTTDYKTYTEAGKILDRARKRSPTLTRM